VAQLKASHAGGGAQPSLSAVGSTPLSPVVAASVGQPASSSSAADHSQACQCPKGSPQAVSSASAVPGIQLSCPSSGSQPVVIGIISLIAGALISHWLSVRRELRKECRGEVDACCKMVAELLDKGRTYFALAAEDEEAKELSSEIVFELHRLTKRVERLKPRYRYFAIEQAIDAVGESLTGGNFDSKDRPKYGASSERVRSIEQDVHSLMDALEDGFSSSFDRSVVQMTATSVKERCQQKVRAAVASVKSWF
jgi:ElaB/YqjD/DUF883 family membrane-anchored ribosome-binding protein